jgi:valyl-tRNA synthetase
MLEKTYQPAEVEGRIYRQWEEAGAFKAGAGKRGAAKPYCIVIPPPNVTGSLHMGHALNNTLQDVLVRFERMRGRDVLWQPGTDHAGIATQMVVERKLAGENKTDRRTIGRKAFLDEVWRWKVESGGTINKQLKRLGASCDWSRDRFTMDEGLSRAVLTVFVGLYENGLIYKDKRLVNWDPKFQTAISDLEVQQVEKKGSFAWADGNPERPFDAEALAKALKKDPSGHLYHFRYPLKDDPRRFVVVATTRPETMLGDTAVAVHPEDERYQALIGRKVVLPLVNQEIRIIADEYSDPEKGTGAVKITPAHDFNDFEVGKRHDLPAINILDDHARILRAGEQLPHERRALDQRSEGPGGVKTFEWEGRGEIARINAIPIELQGLDRFQARLEVVKMMAARGLLARIEPTTHTVPHGDRSGVPIEPWLTDQWYVDAKSLAKAAIEAVESGKTRFVPESWAKTYFDWMRNIEPWCISRQLWWGHQIPAWYGPDGKIFVAMSEAEAYEKAKRHYASLEDPSHPVRGEGQGEGQRQSPAQGAAPHRPGSSAIELTRDEDVLDTWFSSGLWAFSTLGWPDETPELQRYYPTSTLVTGFDIIFFWVARMMMLGLEFMHEVPFDTVYIHALVRDEKGQKMSKSKGNVIDPLELIDAYGADALRFTLTAMAAQGRDIKLAKSRVEGYRNFATKLWNAARFAEMNGCVRVAGFDPTKMTETVNRWITGEVERTAETITVELEAYRFNEAAGAAYQFVWGTFCDWYLELIKPILNGPDGPAKDETRATAAWVLDEILKLMHPFIPFLTEELWAKTGEAGPAREGLLVLTPWPEARGLADRAADEEIGWVIGLVTGIRSVRSEMNVPAGAELELVISGANAETKARGERHGDVIRRLARLSKIGFAAEPPKGSVQIVHGEATAALPLAGVIDIAAERTRLEREIGKAKAEIAKIDQRFANAEFVAKAPTAVIEENEHRKADFSATIEKLGAALKRIKAAG